MTIDREHLELIQADLDGELDGPARAELARYLLAHPEARAERESLSRVCDALARIPAEDPPADLQSSIMAALPQRSVPTFDGGSRSPRSVVVRALPLRIAAGLAGLALVVTLAYQLGSTGVSLPSSQLVGTMGQPAGAEASSAHIGTVHDEARMQVGRFSAVVELHGAPTAPLVSVLVQSGAGLEVVARAGGQEIRLGGVTSDRQSSRGMQVAEFRPLAQPGTDAVQIDLVEPASGAILQRTILRFESER